MNFNILRSILFTTVATLGIQTPILRSAAATTPANTPTKRHLNLIIALEDGVTENPSSDNWSITDDFLRALKEKCTPIITSGAILHNFISRHAIGKNEYVTLYKQKSEYNEIFSPYQQLIEELCAISINDANPNPNNYLEKITLFEQFIAQKEIAAQYSETKEEIERIKQDINYIKNRLENMRPPTNYLGLIKNCNDYHKPVLEYIKVYEVKLECSEIFSPFQKLVEDLYLLSTSNSTQNIDNYLEKIALFEQFIAPKKIAAQYSETKEEIEKIKENINHIKDMLEDMRPPTRYLSSLQDTNDARAVQLTNITDLDSFQAATYACGLQELTFADWLIFKHPTNDLYLFIPHQYMASLHTQWDNFIISHKIASAEVDETLASLGRTKNELLSGFALTSLKKITTKEQLETLCKKTWVKSSSPYRYRLILEKFQEYIPHALQDFFIKKSTKASAEQLMGDWNIILSGHGICSNNIESIKKEIQTNKSIAITDMFDSNAYLCGIPLTHICNMPLTHVKEFLTFLYNAIKTNSLYISSCYASGYHSHKIAQWLEQLERTDGKPYPVIIEGLPNRSTYSSRNISYTNYFSGLESVNFSSKNLQHLNELMQYIQPCNDPNYGCCSGIVNIPSIRFAHSPQWSLLAPDTCVEIDHDMKINNPGGIKIENKKGVLLTTTNIDIPITIKLIQSNIYDQKKLPFIVPCLLGDQQYRFVHIELSTTTPDDEAVPSLAQFLHESIYAQLTDYACLYTTTLHIDSLICNNYENSGISTSSEHEKLILHDVSIIIAPSKKILCAANCESIISSISFTTQDGTRFEGVLDSQNEDYLQGEDAAFTDFAAYACNVISGANTLTNIVFKDEPDYNKETPVIWRKVVDEPQTTEGEDAAFALLALSAYNTASKYTRYCLDYLTRKATITPKS